MVSPQPRGFSTSTRVLDSPKSGGSSLRDELIWNRLREAGFDEESIKRRDKAALISYVSKLETEIFDYQHNMGLLILERKEWTSKYEQLKASSDSAELEYRRELAAYSLSLAEARKREENLKQALGIEKECVVNIEKTLHEMRAESAENKLAADNKLREAHIIQEAAQEKLVGAEMKLREVECLKEEANRQQRAAERRWQEIESREDGLRRQITSFKSDCESKEKEISKERQSLYERQKLLQQGHDRLLEAQTLTNQREELILLRTQEMNLLQMELDKTKLKLEKELMEERYKLDLNIASLRSREEAVIERESHLEKREQELLILQEKLTIKEHDDAQNLKHERQQMIEMTRLELEKELEAKCKMLEEETQTRKETFDLSVLALNRREETIQKRENDLEMQLNGLLEREKVLGQKFKFVEDEQQRFNVLEKELQSEKRDIQKDREQINDMRNELLILKESLEIEKREILRLQEQIEEGKKEGNDILFLEVKLKEEIDHFRAQKQKLVNEANELKEEKEKFEKEWDLLDEKRSKLLKEAERVAEDRKTAEKFLKDELHALKLQKDELRQELNNEIEKLAQEHEEIVSKIQQDHSEWFDRIQQERAGFLKDIEIQKSELNNCIDKRREEIENYLRVKEEEFEQEKMKQLVHISDQKALVAKELEQLAFEMKIIDEERREIAIGKEEREKEWNEINKAIDELRCQREKLQIQRELLQSDREDISLQIQCLENLEDSKLAKEIIAQSEVRTPEVKSNKYKHSRYSDERYPNVTKNSPPISATMSWVRKCAGIVFNHLSEDRTAIMKDSVAKTLSNPEELTMPHPDSPQLTSINNKSSDDDKRIDVTVSENYLNANINIPSLACENMDKTEKLVIVGASMNDGMIAPTNGSEYENYVDEINANQSTREKLISVENGANNSLSKRKRHTNSLSSDGSDELDLFHTSSKRSQPKTALIEEETASNRP